VAVSRYVAEGTCLDKTSTNIVDSSSSADDAAQHQEDLSPIQRLVHDTLKDDARRSDLLALPEIDAQQALEIWTLLELPVVSLSTIGVQSYASRNKFLRFPLKLCLLHDRLPAALFLNDVKALDSESRGIGGFADIYYGTYNGSPVAIKRLRAYVRSTVSKRMKLRQVFCRESLLWKNLSHRHILPFLGVTKTAL